MAGDYITHRKSTLAHETLWDLSPIQTLHLLPHGPHTSAYHGPLMYPTPAQAPAVFPTPQALQAPVLLPGKAYRGRSPRDAHSSPITDSVLQVVTLLKWGPPRQYLV